MICDVLGRSPLCLFQGNLLALVLFAGAIIGALGLHEFAHAATAHWQGDRLPQAQGRLTLNPIRHLDPLGTLLIFLVGFGWAKPVEFRPTALRSKRFGAALVALAGPLTNLLLAVAAAFILSALVRLSPEVLGGDVMGPFLVTFITINVVLAVFNLLPLPPLDGSRLLTIFLPPRHHQILYFLDRYGILILLALLFFVGTAFLEPVIDWVLRTIADVSGI